MERGGGDCLLVKVVGVTQPERGEGRAAEKTQRAKLKMRERVVAIIVAIKG